MKTIKIKDIVKVVEFNLTGLNYENLVIVITCNDKGQRKATYLLTYGDGSLTRDPIKSFRELKKELELDDNEFEDNFEHWDFKKIDWKK